MDDVSFAVARGEIVALLGPNGAGKTTTLRMLAGLIEPTSGEVVLDGIRLSRPTAGALRARVGFLTEAPGLWERLTVRENLRIYARLYGLDAPDAAIDRAIGTFELWPYDAIRTAELSKGTRQKVAIARALLHEPPILLLDEPTSGLDPEIVRTLRRLLVERRDAGCAILVSTHNLDEAGRLADRVAVLNGRLLAIDSPAALRARMAGGRVVVRLAGDARAGLETAKAFDPDASADGNTLVLRLHDAERQTPGLVESLVAAGMRIVEVRHDVPALEDAYLQVVGT